MSVRRTAPPQFLFLSSGSREEVREAGTERSGASALIRGLPHDLLPPRCYVTSWTAHGLIMQNLGYTSQTHLVSHQHWATVSMRRDHKISFSSKANQTTRVPVGPSHFFRFVTMPCQMFRWVPLPERPPPNSEGESADLLTRHIILQPRWCACWQPAAARRPWRISWVTSACCVSAGDLSEQQDTSEPFYKKTRRRTAASSRCSCTSVTTLTTVCVSPSVSISLLSAWCIAAPDRRICLLRVNWQWCMENTFGCAAGKHDIYSHKCWFLNIWIQIRSSVLDSCPIRSFSICRMNTELHSKLSAVICIN